MNQIARDSRGLYFQLNEISKGLVSLAQLYGRSNNYTSQNLTYISNLLDTYPPMMVLDYFKKAPECAMFNDADDPMAVIEIAQKFAEVNALKRLAKKYPGHTHQKTKHLLKQVAHLGFLKIPSANAFFIDYSETSFPALGAEPAAKKKLRRYQPKTKRVIEVIYPNALSPDFKLDIASICTNALKVTQAFKDNQIKERLQFDNKEVWPTPAEAFRPGMQHHGRRHTKPSLCR